MSEENMSGKELTGSIILIACMAHETNRAYCEANGDFSIPEWESAPQWMVQSAIDGVGHVLSNPEVTPEESHKNWMAQRIRDNWVYGKEKNVELKMHPSLVPYSELPQTEKVKDHLFVSTVKTMARMLGVV